MPSIREWVMGVSESGEPLNNAMVAKYRSKWLGFKPEVREQLSRGLDEKVKDMPWYTGKIIVDPKETVVQKKRSAEKPTLLQKAVTFAKAATKHVAAGMPQSPPGVIEARLAICQGCEKFQNNHCSVCGCACNSSTFMNKLAWARESCPHPDGPKWGPHEQSI